MLQLPNIVLDEVLGCISSSELRQLRGISKEWNLVTVPFAMASMPFEPNANLLVLEKYGKFVKELVIGNWRHELKDKAAYLARLMPNVEAIKPRGNGLKIDAEWLLLFGMNLPKLKHMSVIGLKEEMWILEPLLKKLSIVEMEISWEFNPHEIASKLNPNIRALLVQGKCTFHYLSLLLHALPSLDKLQYRPTPTYNIGTLYRDPANAPFLFSFGTLFHISFDNKTGLTKSYKELNTFLKLAFHPNFKTCQLLKSHLPPIHAIDYTAIGSEYALDTIVLSQLTEAKQITLRWSNAVAEPVLPNLTYAATAITINGRITTNLFPWLKANFPNLTFLSLAKPVPRHVLNSISALPHLLTFATPSVQSRLLYKSLIKSAKALKLIATPDPMPELALEFPAISFVPYSE